MLGEVLGHRLAGARSCTSPCSSPASRRCFITTGTPPTRSRSLMWNLPPGFMSAMCGTLAAMRLKSSRSSVDAGLVGDGQQVQHGVGRAAERRGDGDGVLERLLGHDLARRDARAAACSRRPRRRDRRRPRGGRRSAGGDAVPGRLMPSASAIELIVLAVNMPPHAPSPGQALRSISPSSSSVIVPAAHAPTASNTLVMSSATPLCSPGHDRAVVDEHARQVEAGRGHQHRRDALVAAGQPDEAVEALGVHHALDRVGDDLAADERGAHALVAHLMPSLTGDRAELHRERRRPSRTPALACSASLRSVMLHGVTSFHDVGDRRSAACPSRRRSARRPAASPAPAPSACRR